MSSEEPTIDEMRDAWEREQKRKEYDRRPERRAKRREYMRRYLAVPENRAKHNQKSLEQGRELRRLAKLAKEAGLG